MPTPTSQQTAQTCSGMAYYVLPMLAFERPDILVNRLEEDPRKTILLAYFAACEQSGFEPCRQAAAQLKVHAVPLDANLKTFIIQYPTPPESLATGTFAPSEPVPHFSAIVRDEYRSTIEIFVLAQLPWGGTTLRLVTPVQTMGLGPGCAPNLNEFAELLRQRIRSLAC